MCCSDDARQIKHLARMFAASMASRLCRTPRAQTHIASLLAARTSILCYLWQNRLSSMTWRAIKHRAAGAYRDARHAHAARRQRVIFWRIHSTNIGE